MKVKLIFSIAFISLLSYIVADEIEPDEYRTVETKYGKLRGKRNTTLLADKFFYSFRGIPFAKVPVGPLRFKPPKPVEPWTGVKDAFEFGSKCVQVDALTKGARGKEDCLYLNVFVPNVKSSKKLPVMFFIHGGGYVIGSASGYGPDFLINNDVILVTTNYRLNVLGFMSLGNSEYSGNMGLKDQTLALKWVNENIEKFGGDSKQITIFGESAGSSSVHYHVLSPLSSGLFQRAILQSGSVLNPWAISSLDNHLREMKAFATERGKLKSELYDNLVAFLHKVSAETLAKEFNRDFYELGEPTKSCDNRFGPVIEVDDAEDAFLIKSPLDILKTKTSDKVDVLFGFTTAEMYTLIQGDLQYPALLEPFNKAFQLQLPKRQFLYDYESDEYKTMAKEIREYYFGKKDGQVNKESLAEFNQMLSDIWFVYGIHESVKLNVDRSSAKTYLYRFSLESNLDAFKASSGAKSLNLPGTAHADDLFYLFNVYESLFFEKYTNLHKSLSPNSLEAKLIQTATALWTNFAKYGTPTPKSESEINLKPVQEDVINYVDVTNDGLVTGVNPNEESIKFWDDFYRKHQRSFHGPEAYLHDEL